MTALQNAGSGSSHADVLFFTHPSNYTVPLGYDKTVHWTKATNYGGDGGMLTITLPAVTRDWGERMIFNIQSWNWHGSTGQIMIVVPSGGPSWLSSSYLWDDDSSLYNSQTVLLSNTGRKHYTCIYEYDINDKWFVNETNNIDSRIPDALLTQITTNETAIANAHFLKFFPNDESGYAPLNQAGNHYTIPDGHQHIQLVYGDGLETQQANCHGVWVNLPANPVDGCVVKHCSLHNYNSTSNSDVIVIDFSQTGNQPVGRKLVDDHVLYTRGGTETALVEGHSTSTSSGRKESVFFYIQATDTWVHRLASY